MEFALQTILFSDPKGRGIKPWDPEYSSVVSGSIQLTDFKMLRTWNLSFIEINSEVIAGMKQRRHLQGKDD